MLNMYIVTRTKTSIRYAKENDREKREREMQKERYREGGRDIQNFEKNVAKRLRATTFAIVKLKER